MKKMISLLLALTLALTLCACVTPKTPMPIEDGDKSAAQPVTVRLGGLKGPTSMGMVKLLDDAESGATENGYEFTMAASANELTPQLVQGELDIVAVPANVAAILYNQTEGGVELLAAGTLGVLYMVEKGGETVTDVASLSGKTIYATGKGATPEYALTYLLSQHGLTLGTDVQVEWKSEPTEIVALMAEQENAVAMLPQPFVTVAQGQVEGAARGSRPERGVGQAGQRQPTHHLGAGGAEGLCRRASGGGAHVPERVRRQHGLRQCEPGGGGGAGGEIRHRQGGGGGEGAAGVQSGVHHRHGHEDRLGGLFTDAV